MTHYPKQTLDIQSILEGDKQRYVLGLGPDDCDALGSFAYGCQKVRV